MNEFILRIHILIRSSLSSVFPRLTFKISHHVSLSLRFRPDHPIHVGWRCVVRSTRREHRILTCVLGICFSSCRSVAWANVGRRSTWWPIWIMELSFRLWIITDNTSSRISTGAVKISRGHSSCHFSVLNEHWRRSCQDASGILRIVLVVQGCSRFERYNSSCVTFVSCHSCFESCFWRFSCLIFTNWIWYTMILSWPCLIITRPHLLLGCISSLRLLCWTPSVTLSNLIIHVF